MNEEYDFTKPITVKINGNSPPMEGVDANQFCGTTYVKAVHPYLEERPKPLERAKPKRRAMRLCNKIPRGEEFWKTRATKMTR